MSPLLSWAALIGVVALVVGVLLVATPRHGARVDPRPTAAPTLGRHLRAVPMIGGDGPARGDGPSPLHLTRSDVAAAILLSDDEFAEHVRMRGSMARHPAAARFHRAGGDS